VSALLLLDGSLLLLPPGVRGVPVGGLGAVGGRGGVAAPAAAAPPSAEPARSGGRGMARLLDAGEPTSPRRAARALPGGGVIGGIGANRAA